MCALAAAVRPSAAGGPRRAATALSDATERAFSGKKRPCVGVAPARDSPACLTKMTQSRNSVVTATGTEVLTVGGEMSSQELLQKRLACELDALRGLLKKAELISRRGGACNGGAPTAAGKKDRLLASNLASNQRGDRTLYFNAPSVKRRKISTLVEQKQKQTPAPRVSQEERNQIAGRLSSLSGELPGHIVEFLQKHFGDADTNGEIEINIDTVQDSVLFELKTHLDKLTESQHQPTEPASETVQSTAQAESVSGESIGGPAQLTVAATEVAQAQSAEAKKVQDAQRAAHKAAVYMPGLLYRANLRRQLLEMERTKLPDESIHPRDLQRLGIMEYGRPSIMRQLGLVLKVDA